VLRLRSANVIHSLWIPKLAGKLDVMPDGINTLVLQADEPGEHSSECAELCGLQHAQMALTVVVSPPRASSRGSAASNDRAAKPAGGAAQRGAEIVVEGECAECHTIRGTQADGSGGPDLTDVASRPTLGAGAVANSDGNLRAWVTGPQALKDGVKMPAPRPHGPAARRGARLSGDARVTTAQRRARPGTETPTVFEPPTGKELDELFADEPGLWGQLTAVQNDKIGVRLLLTGFFFLLLGGSFDSVMMRLQLAVPENSFISPQLYNELFTNHGSVTMFLVILPVFEGFAILLLPFLLGTRELPYPRLGAFSYWTFLFGGLLYYSATLWETVPDAGWFAYTPLSRPEFSPDLALDFWVLGFGVAEVGAIAAAFELIIGILEMRAPGMTLSRMPLFAWAILVMSFMICSRSRR
jgi:cytochrome c2